MTDYVLEFGMDCILIDEVVYKDLESCIYGGLTPATVWRHIKAVDGQVYFINISQIKYIHKDDPNHPLRERLL